MTIGLEVTTVSYFREPVEETLREEDMEGELPVRSFGTMNISNGDTGDDKWGSGGATNGGGGGWGSSGNTASNGDGWGSSGVAQANATNDGW
jgi:hypothetical protein